MSTTGKKLVAASLNYSGILNSPFEFYSSKNDHAETELSKLFQINLNEMLGKMENGKDFDWKISDIDKVLQKDRYTPIYRDTVGIKGQKLVSTKDFEVKWD